MREFVLNVLEGGDVVAGLDEKRNYYYFEIEELNNIFGRACELGGRELTKRIRILLHGEIVFNDEITVGSGMLEKVVFKEINKSTKNTLGDYAEFETELIKDSRFKDFIIRYDEVLCSPDMLPIPYFLSLEQLKKVFEHVVNNVQHLFYSKFSDIISSLKELNEIVVGMIGEEEDLQYEFYSFLEDEGNFIKYCNYVPSRMSSLSFSRINALYPNYKPYQNLQDLFFKYSVYYLGFEKVKEIHLSMIKAFEEEFHLKLFLGDLLLEDEHFNVKVLNPVINKFQEKIVKELEEYVKENGLDESVVENIKKYN